MSSCILQKRYSIPLIDQVQQWTFSAERDGLTCSVDMSRCEPVAWQPEMLEPATAELLQFEKARYIFVTGQL